MYINAILNSLQSRKYCEVIMDDLLLFTPSKRVAYGQIGRSLKGIKKEWFENISKEISAI